jgi:hypothetical protein
MQARSGFDDCVGNTPLILLSGLSRATSCLIYGSTPPQSSTPRAPSARCMLGLTVVL